MATEALSVEQAVVEDRGGEVALDAGRALRVGFATPHGVLVLRKPERGDCVELHLLRPGKPLLSVARARRGTDELVVQLWLWLVARNAPPPTVTCKGCDAQARERDERAPKRLAPLGWAYGHCPACKSWHKRLRRWTARAWAKVLGKRP